MKLELSSTETRVVLEALKKYRIIKNAEGKLQSQKQKSGETIAAAYVPYQKLLDTVDSVLERLT